MSDIEEIWKDLSEVEGFEGYTNYFISNFGRVKSTKYLKDRYLKFQIDKDGYYRVRLNLNGKGFGFGVHRLVALAFVPNNDKLNNIIVHHVDGDKQNARFDNLEWMTPKQNIVIFWASESSLSTRKKKSESMKGKMVGEKNPFYGKTHPPELLKRIADKNRGRTVSEKTRKKLSDALSGEKNPFYGRTHTPESRQKIVDGLKKHYKKIA